MQSVITHYNTFIHTGCKVPWALRGGYWECGCCDSLTVICSLQAVPTNHKLRYGQRIIHSVKAHDSLPIGRKKSVVFSLPFHVKVCEHFHGDGGYEGVRERAVSVMVYVF